MSEEYIKFVELHNIDRKIALEVYLRERKFGSSHFGVIATNAIVNRNALYQLRLITGIK